MRSQFRGMTFCFAVVFIGCSQSPQESVVQKPKGADVTSNDLVFNVEGLTWGAVSGLGWGSRLAPVLEQLEKVDGVKSAMANHSGTMVRVVLSDAAEAESVSSELASILGKQQRKAKPLQGDEVATAIKNEQWRTAETIGELSEIEFRTVFSRRVKQFIEANDLNGDTNAKLIRFSEESLSETPKSNANTDWGTFCGGLADRLLEKAKPLLSESQLEDLAKKLKARVLG